MPSQQSGVLAARMYDNSGREPERAFRHHNELDLLRFVAFFLVFLAHLFPRLPNEYTDYVSPAAAYVLSCLSNAFAFGLCLFFFLSAFLITTLLLEEKQRTGTVSIRDFYIRRILRIWPLYGLGLVGLAVFGYREVMAGGPESALYPDMLVFYLLMAGNWFVVTMGIPWPSNPFTPLWSISIEEQYYLFWPAIMKSRTRTGILIVSALLIALAVLLQFLFGLSPQNRDITVWTNSFIQFEFFGLGSLAALWLHGKTFRLAKRWRFALVLVALASATSANVMFHAKEVSLRAGNLELVLGYLCIGLFVFSLFLAVYGMTKILNIFIYLGKVSYGLYVFHLVGLMAAELIIGTFAPFPLVAQKTLTIILGFTLTVGIAAASYHFYELPFLTLKKRFSKLEP